MNPVFGVNKTVVETLPEGGRPAYFCPAIHPTPMKFFIDTANLDQIREAAAKAYAKNQKISIKGARTVFPDLSK